MWMSALPLHVETFFRSVRYRHNVGVPVSSHLSYEVQFEISHLRTEIRQRLGHVHCFVLRVDAGGFQRTADPFLHRH